MNRLITVGCGALLALGLYSLKTKGGSLPTNSGIVSADNKQKCFKTRRFLGDSLVHTAIWCFSYYERTEQIADAAP